MAADTGQDPAVSVFILIVENLLKGGPMAAVLFFLLREQMSRYDKFLEMIELLRQTIEKLTISNTELKAICHTMQEDTKRRADLDILREQLRREGSGKGGGEDVG